MFYFSICLFSGVISREIGLPNKNLCGQLDTVLPAMTYTQPMHWMKHMALKQTRENDQIDLTTSPFTYIYLSMSDSTGNTTENSSIFSLQKQ